MSEKRESQVGKKRVSAQGKRIRQAGAAATPGQVRGGRTPAVGEKIMDPREAVARSVVDFPSESDGDRPRVNMIVFNIANAADAIPAWGVDLKARDRELRAFWKTEPILASAVYSVATRIAVLEWHIVNADPTKPKQKNTIRAVERMLNMADRGNGWQVFLMKVLTDVFTQDNGAFIEIIRRENKEDSPVIGIAHLDSWRCTRTGDPKVPVIYEDRLGRYHKLRWYQVITLEEMPAPEETMYGAQVCALSRALRAAQIIRDIAVYKQEKVSGSFARSLHFVSGVSSMEIEAALARAQEQMLNQGLYRYQQPPIVTTIDPTHELRTATIDLASLPDHFDEDTTMRWYISQLALAFGVDYQEFAPLPGGALGSSQQSEILHLKARGKGPAAMIRRIEHILNNYGILPSNVRFEFKSIDSRADEDLANARYTRGRDRALRLTSGELTAEAAVRLAVLDGDLPEHLAEQILSSSPVTPERAPNPYTDEQVRGGIEARLRQRDSREEAIRVWDLVKRGELRLPEPLQEHLPQRIREIRETLSGSGNGRHPKPRASQAFARAASIVLGWIRSGQIGATQGKELLDLLIQSSGLDPQWGEIPTEILSAVLIEDKE